MGISFWQIAIVAALVLLIFGPKRIPGLGKALGEAIRGFRTGLKGEGEKPAGEKEKITEAGAAEKEKSPPPSDQPDQS